MSDTNTRYYDIVERWLYRFMDKIKVLKNSSSEIYVVAISRKMPRFFNWIENCFLVDRPELKNLYNQTKSQYYLTTEIAIPFIFRGSNVEAQDCTAVLVVDDTVVIGNTLRTVSSDLDAYYGKKPQAMAFVSKGDYTPTQLGVATFESAAVIQSDVELENWIKFVCDCNLSSSLPIDVEFPILWPADKNHTIDSLIDNIKTGMPDVFEDYKIFYDTESDYYSYNLVDLSSSLRDYKIDFVKLRFFKKGDNFNLSVFAPRFIRQSEMLNPLLFEQPSFKKAWDAILENIDTDRYKKSRLFQTLAVCINYLNSLSTFNKIGREGNPNTTFEVKSYDLSLIFGPILADRMLSLISDVITSKQIEMLPLGPINLQNMLVPEAFSSKYLVHRNLAMMNSKSGDVDTILEKIFALSDLAKGIIGISGSIFHMMHSVIFESFESLIKLCMPRKRQHEDMIAINKWVDTQIDKGGIIPKYIELSNTGEQYWRRLFMNSSSNL